MACSRTARRGSRTSRKRSPGARDRGQPRVGQDGLDGAAVAAGDHVDSSATLAAAAGPRGRTRSRRPPWPGSPAAGVAVLGPAAGRRPALHIGRVHFGVTSFGPERHAHRDRGLPGQQQPDPPLLERLGEERLHIAAQRGARRRPQATVAPSAASRCSAIVHSGHVVGAVPAGEAVEPAGQAGRVDVHPAPAAGRGTGRHQPVSASSARSTSSSVV
jgi:hypothetical protein